MKSESGFSLAIASQRFQKPTIWGRSSSSLGSESSPWTSWQTKGTDEERDGKSGMEKEGQEALSNKSLS